MLQAGASRMSGLSAIVGIAMSGVASLWLLESPRFSTPDGVALRGGTICTMVYVKYDCSDCIDDEKCGEQSSMACESYTAPQCVECWTANGGDCPGPTHEYMANTNPPCFIQLAVWIPNCPQTQWAQGGYTGCDGGCG